MSPHHSSPRDQAITIRASLRQQDLSDRTFYLLEIDACARFPAKFDSSPPSDALRDLLRRKTPWE